MSMPIMDCKILQWVAADYRISNLAAGFDCRLLRNGRTQAAKQRLQRDLVSQRHRRPDLLRNSLPVLSAPASSILLGRMLYFVGLGLNDEKDITVRCHISGMHMLILWFPPAPRFLVSQRLGSCPEVQNSVP